MIKQILTCAVLAAAALPAAAGVDITLKDGTHHTFEAIDSITVSPDMSQTVWCSGQGRTMKIADIQDVKFGEGGDRDEYEVINKYILYQMVKQLRLGSFYYLTCVHVTDEFVHPYSWIKDGKAFNNYSLGDLLSDTENIDNGWLLTTYAYNTSLSKELVALAEATEPESAEGAEIRFLRDLEYFRALMTFGPLPLPSSNVWGKPEMCRQHFDKCVAWLADDLQKLAGVLPATKTENYTPTASAALALRGRLLLYAASPLWNGSFPYPDWTNTGVTPADPELGTPDYGHELVSGSYDASKWQKALQANLEALAEATGAGGRSLFTDLGDLDVSSPTYVPWDCGQEFSDKVMLMRYLPVTDDAEGNHEIILSIPSDAYNLYARLPHKIILRENGTYPDAWSGTNPTLDYVAAMYTDKGYLPTNDPTFAKSSWYEPAGLTDDRESIINYHVHREPRFYAWIGYDGGDYGNKLYNNERPVLLNLRDVNAQGYDPSTYNRDFCASGYLFQKGISPKLFYNEAGYWSGRSLTDQLIRLAELYLNIAECYAALGNQAEALKYLNVVRNRAGVPDLTAAMISETGMPLMDWVLNERYVELALEGHRYYDMRRHLIADKAMHTPKTYNVMQTYPSVEEYYTLQDYPIEYNWSDRKYLLPLATGRFFTTYPTSLCILFPDLVQAPGWENWPVNTYDAFFEFDAAKYSKSPERVVIDPIRFYFSCGLFPKQGTVTLELDDNSPVVFANGYKVDLDLANAKTGTVIMSGDTQMTLPCLDLPEMWSVPERINSALDYAYAKGKIVFDGTEYPVEIPIKIEYTNKLAIKLNYNDDVTQNNADLKVNMEIMLQQPLDHDLPLTLTSYISVYPDKIEWPYEVVVENGGDLVMPAGQTSLKLQVHGTVPKVEVTNLTVYFNVSADEYSIGPGKNSVYAYAPVEYNNPHLIAFSTNDQEPTEGKLIHLFDNNPSTYFHSTWSQTPNHDATYGSYVDMTFDEPMQEFTFTFTSRNVANNKGVPDHVKLFGSNDGQTWTLVGEKENMSEEVPGGLCTVTCGPYKADSPFTMLRFAVLKSVVGDLTTANSSYWNGAELLIEPVE